MFRLLHYWGTKALEEILAIIYRESHLVYMFIRIVLFHDYTVTDHALTVYEISVKNVVSCSLLALSDPMLDMHRVKIFSVDYSNMPPPEC